MRHRRAKGTRHSGRGLDLKWETSRGLVANPDTVKAKVIAGATEEEIFKCLGIDFIPPVERERHEVGRVSPCAPGSAEHEHEKGDTTDYAESFS